MTDPRILRHLKVLSDAVDTGPVKAQKFFAIGNAAEVDGEGEVVPLISFVDDNLSRFVVSNAPSSSWGRAVPAPWITALPNREVKVKDAVFLLTGAGEDRDEAHPSGSGRMHFVHLGLSRRLWETTSGRLYVYRLEAVQTRAILPPAKSFPDPPKNA